MAIVRKGIVEDIKKKTKLENQDRIIKVNIEEEMKSSYIDYSMSVIVARALPDARDGLKPVHRRILYSMMRDGNTSDKGYRKSARTEYCRQSQKQYCRESHKSRAYRHQFIWNRCYRSQKYYKYAVFDE